MVNGDTLKNLSDFPDSATVLFLPVRSVALSLAARIMADTGHCLLSSTD